MQSCALESRTQWRAVSAEKNIAATTCPAARASTRHQRQGRTGHRRRRPPAERPEGRAHADRQPAPSPWPRPVASSTGESALSHVRAASAASAPASPSALATWAKPARARARRSPRRPRTMADDGGRRQGGDPIAAGDKDRLEPRGWWQGRAADRGSPAAVRRRVRPSAATRAAVSPAPGSGRVIRTPGRSDKPSGKDVGGLSARRLAPSSRPIRAASPARAVQAALQQERAVGTRHQPGQVQFAIRQQPRMSADRRAAGAVERRQQGAFGGGDRLRLGVLDGGEQLVQSVSSARTVTPTMPWPADGTIASGSSTTDARSASPSRFSPA